jgi:Spy/CpxP family protein refolding chaperone
MDQNLPSSPRRGFFRLAALSTAAAGMAGLGFNAFAHGRRHGGGGAGMSEEHLDRMLKHVYVEIDATDAQKQKLDPIVKQAAKELRPLRQKAQDARRRGTELFAADTIDRGAIERARVEQIGATDAASKRFTQALTDVADVLTPEQRKKLAARFAGRGRGGRGHLSS